MVYLLSYDGRFIANRLNEKVRLGEVFLEKVC